MNIRAVSLDVKRPGFEADHSTATSAEVKNAAAITPHPPDVFMV
jgi:hypothetical protein